MKTLTIKRAFLPVTLMTIFMLVSCEDELKTVVESQLTPDNFYQSEGDANAALITLYVPFTSNWGNPDPGLPTTDQWRAALYNADLKTYLMRSMLTTDEISNDGTFVNAGPLTNFTWGSATWTGGNEPNYPKISYVAKATEVIQAIGKSTAVSDAVKASYIAQAKTLRAWLMYVLYDFYGPVNVKTEFESLTDTEPTPRLSNEEYVAKMVQDLEEAIPDLKDKYNADAGNWGRVSKGTARMLLLKIYMHTKQWAKAESTAKEIMTMGYSLLTGPMGYKDIFVKEMNAEIIYAVPANDASPNFWLQEVLPGDFQSAPGISARNVGWNENYMSWAYYDKYDPTDIRRNTTILNSYTNQDDNVVTRASGMRGAIPVKYMDPTPTEPGQPHDIVVFRYAEVLLSLAEAINEQRGPAEAYQYVNQVRARAGVTAFAGMTQADLKTALLAERGRELFAEGVRRQDLIRNGSFISNALARGKTAAAAHMVLFPIPNTVIVQGKGVIAQNTGYTD
ncbi:MAG TPA: RagB/SusD family nutrient uptake outer membrane protein [Cyclobacteriaceae bacterium]|nr:RagB/SusD family nutrient uptake outer membrane protein [Cyclobacteriaceae bacterium]